MGNLMIEHECVCHVSVFPTWFGIGWVVIALAECNTIRVKCGIPWQVNPNGWPCQGPLHVTPPIGTISLGPIALGAIALGSNSLGANPVGEISLEQHFGRRAAGNGRETWARAQVKMHNGIRWLSHFAPLLLHLDPAPAWFHEP